MKKKHLTVFLCGPIRCRRSESKEKFEELVFRCGSDPSRRFDSFKNLDAASDAIGRMPLITSGEHKPLMVCTLTNPLNLTVLRFRKELCARYSVLSATLWAICVDTELDPFFWDNAANLGYFDVPLGDPAEDGKKLQLWRPAPNQSSCVGERHLVITQQTVAGKDFLKGIETLWERLDELRPLSGTLPASDPSNGQSSRSQTLRAVTSPLSQKR
jgi:hypothetical protein